MAKKIRVGIIGVGNCFAGLIQGIEYYKKPRTRTFGSVRGRNKNKKIIGLMHEKIGPYDFCDIEFVSAFDVGANKIGKNLNKAVSASPNLVKWIKLPKSRVIVREAPVLDGIGIYVENKIKPLKNPSPIEKLKEEIEKELKRTKTEVLVNYLPVGSQKATEFWAEMALKTGCAFVNCLPAFIASDKKWAEKFKRKRIPIIGDDIKGQIGATIVHRILAKLCSDRGATIDKTYQINVGGNSVTGDQMLLLKINGEIRYKKIGEFIDNLIENCEAKKRKDGKEVITKDDCSERIECLTVDDDFKVRTIPVEAFIRHKISEPIFEIELEGGRKIKITKDHNLFILDETGRLREIPVKELKAGKSFISVPENLSFFQEEKRFIDLKFYYRKLMQSSSYREGKVKIKNNFFEICGYPEIKIPVKFPLSDEFLQIVGIWLADGSYDRKGSSNIELACGNDSDSVKVVASFCKDLNLSYRIKGGKQVGLRINSKILGSLFKTVFELKGIAFTKRVPSWIFNLSDRQISQVLKGYVSGDGGTIGDQVRWTSVSEELIRDIQTLFLRIGINSTIFKEIYPTGKRKKAYPSRIGYCWHGLITGYKDFKIFTERVKFLQEEKNQKLSIIFKDKKESLREKLIPNLSVLRERWKIKSETWWRCPQISAGVVMNQLEKVKDDNLSSHLYNLCQGEVKFLKVKKIKQIKSGENKYVYDLSVKPYERFICSNILVHNTDFLNMLERTRLESKKISKTQAVTSQINKEIPADKIYIGPSDFIPFLGNMKLAFIRVEGRMFADIPYSVELRLEVDDKANSAGVVIDAIRCAKLALDRKIGGYLDVSSYFMKHPLVQKTDNEAKDIVETFIRK